MTSRPILPSALRFSSLALLAALAGCGAPSADDAGAATADEAIEGLPEDPLESELVYDGKSYPYVYTGPLPKLIKPSITISIASHTARITGILPASWNETVPFYAKVTRETTATGTARRLTIVYPVATGALTNGPGLYPDIAGVPFVPTTVKAAWGGFPYLQYNHRRGLAIHGPITHSDKEWRLIRGPVSHGCNRMQGEHVVELAQLLGLDMRVAHKVWDRARVTVPVNVITAYDTWNGKYVDVDYPIHPSVKRPPASKSTLFRTWDSRDLPTLVCPYDKTRALGVDHCDNRGVDRLDLGTGL